MNLTVNGVDTSIESGPLTSLLDVLREELGITSPKAGCEQGGCGACTVLVDGEPRRSCLTPVAAVDGSRDHDGRGPRLTGATWLRSSRRSRITTPPSAASAPRG